MTSFLLDPKAAHPAYRRRTLQESVEVAKLMLDAHELFEDGVFQVVGRVSRLGL